MTDLMDDDGSLSDETLDRLREMRYEHQERRRIVAGLSENPYTPDKQYRVMALRANDPEEDLHRLYVDGLIVDVVDRYSRCPDNLEGFAHVQSMVRSNYCGLCKKALTEI